MPTTVEKSVRNDRQKESTMTIRSASAITFAAGVIPLLVMFAGCGGTESTASRSAAAYDEAQRKGVAVGGAAHGGEGAHGDGGHVAEPSPQKGTVSPAMPGMDHANMPGMKPPGRGATEPRPMAGMDHSGMAGMGAQSQARTDPHAGMDHSKMPGTPPSGAAMDHSKMTGVSHDMPISPPAPEPLSATAKPGQPAETLQADALDQPPATSVADAARSAAMATEMSGGGHGMSHGTYRHVDAGRDTETPSPKPSPQVKEHKH